MNGLDWPEMTETWDSDWPETNDWGGDSADFLPLPFPSPSVNLARTLLGRGGRKPAPRPSVVPRPAPRPAAASGPVPPVLRDELTKVYETMKRLEQKQTEQTQQLAMIQARTAGVQMGDVFRQSLTTAAINATPLFLERNWAGGAVHLFPLVQSWRGISPSVKGKPLSTLGFPLLAAAAMVLLRKPEEPAIKPTRTTDVRANPADVTLEARGAGLRLFYTTNGSEPTTNSTRYNGPFRIDNPARLQVRAFTPFGVGSNVAEMSFI